MAEAGRFSGSFSSRFIIRASRLGGNSARCQVGDTGVITGDGWLIRVTNTQRLPNDLIVHQGVVEQGVVKVNDPAHLEVDAERREITIVHVRHRKDAYRNL